MKIPVVFLLLISFLQGTVIGADLVLLALISRSLVVNDQENYYLAFGFGLLLSLLYGLPMGFLSLTYLLAVKITRAVRETKISSSWLVVLPLVLALSVLNSFVLSTVKGHSLDLRPVIFQTLLSLPVYLATLFWEERFIPRRDIKLKIKG